MIAALVEGDRVANVIVLPDGADLTLALANSFGGTGLVEVTADAAVGPGWGYDPNADPPFTALPDPAPIPPTPPDPVAQIVPVLAAIAADPDKTQDEKVTAILAALAVAAA